MMPIAGKIGEALELSPKAFSSNGAKHRSAISGIGPTVHSGDSCGPRSQRHGSASPPISQGSARAIPLPGKKALDLRFRTVRPNHLPAKEATSTQQFDKALSRL